MPRKAKPASERKDRVIQIRLTEEDYRRFQEAAAAAHLELSTFVRQLVLFNANKRLGSRTK
jgi:uncharacterized protein (DUF1778 family)